MSPYDRPNCSESRLLQAMRTLCMLALRSVLKAFFISSVRMTKSFVQTKWKKGSKRFLRKCQKILFDPIAVRSFVLILDQDNVANTQEYNFNFSEVKQLLLCWLTSERDKNRQPLPVQKCILVRFELKHDSNLKLRNAGNYLESSVLLGNHDRFKR